MKYPDTFLATLRAALLLFLVLAAASTQAETSTETWQENDADSEVVIDHSPWQAILDAYLVAEHPSGVNRFDYAGVSDSDKKALQNYLASIQSVDPRTLNKREQLAYWVNFYNAGTIHVVLENYPVKSIRKIRPDFFALSLGPWDHPYFSVAGQALTLNDIEHGILRPIWKEPRLHFVLNCASVGCPDLSASAFTADNVEAQMESLTKAFLAHPRAVAIAGDKLKLSSLFDW